MVLTRTSVVLTSDVGWVEIVAAPDGLDPAATSTSDAVEGDVTCPGIPPVRQVIELDQPLGDRDLLDGSTWPAEPVGGP